MKKGTVKFFNETKGFGFITDEEGGKDYFVHSSKLSENSCTSARKVSKVISIYASEYQPGFGISNFSISQIFIFVFSAISS